MNSPESKKKASETMKRNYSLNKDMYHERQLKARETALRNGNIGFGDPEQHSKSVATRKQNGSYRIREDSSNKRLETMKERGNFNNWNLAGSAASKTPEAKEKWRESMRKNTEAKVKSFNTYGTKSRYREFL